MTTDDMREIEAALDEFRDDWGWSLEQDKAARDKLLALIRQKLPAPAGTQQMCRGDFDLFLHHDGTGTTSGIYFTVTWKESGRVDKFVPVTDDAEHERAVEAWTAEATRISIHCGVAMHLVQRLRDEGASLMRARPEIEPHTFTGLPDTTYEELVAKEKAAAELLRAAKAFVMDDEWCEDGAALVYFDAIKEAIEAAERAWVR